MPAREAVNGCVTPGPGTICAKYGLTMMASGTNETTAAAVTDDDDALAAMITTIVGFRTFAGAV